MSASKWFLSVHKIKIYNWEIRNLFENLYCKVNYIDKCIKRAVNVKIHSSIKKLLLQQTWLMTQCWKYFCKRNRWQHILHCTTTIMLLFVGHGAIRNSWYITEIIIRSIECIYLQLIRWESLLQCYEISNLRA